ncbi:MAG: transcriptional regulator [Oscillospiraceae bacterium]|nr:transcriptional regulator [Oscillospiraceae bacterium]
MVRNTHGVVEFAPLYIHSFNLFQPHKLLDAEKFNITYSDPAQLISTADKLRYYRYKKALRQIDVADYAGIDRSTYNSYENDERDLYPLEFMQKITQILDVKIEDILDDYNMFLYHGQGRKIKELRKSMKLTQYEFGKLHGVNRRTIERWENEKVQIFKSTWEKLFR